MERICLPISLKDIRIPCLFLLTLRKKRVPNPASPNTLVVHPGDYYNQNSLFLYDTIWFAPGIHDLSRRGSAPWYQVKIKKGQTYYLEGGSYVKARFKEDDLGTGPSSIIGREIISWIDHPWVRSFPEGSQVISIDSVIGVTITDRACFGIYGGHYIGDVAMVGAWHGNTDGPDYTDNCLIENCFLMAKTLILSTIFRVLTGTIPGHRSAVLPFQWYLPWI